MKRSDLTFGALLVPLDYILLVAAGLLAYAVRFSSFYTKFIREATVTIEFTDYFGLVLLVSIVWLVVFALAGLYKLRTYRKLWDELAKVVLACSTGILVVVIAIFLNRELFASRFVVLAAWLFAIILVSLGRAIAREIQRHFLSRGRGVHNLLVVGENRTARAVSEYFNAHLGHGFRVVRTLPDFAEDKARLFREIVETERVDEVLLADPELPRDQRFRLIKAINEHHLDFKYAADLIGLSSGKTESTTLAGIPIVEVKKTPLEGWGRINKRIFDVFISFIGLLALLIPFLIMALIIKLDSHGPVLYRSWRVGGRGRKFGLWKFRTMRAGADQEKAELLAENERADGPLFKLRDDPRITRVGKILRRWSIDELPQLWNVLLGEISLVGPRPHEPHEVAQYERHHQRLLDIKPGITGLAQVSGRSDLSFEGEVRLDTYYIDNWSLWLDLKILLQTPRAVLAARKAA